MGADNNKAEKAEKKAMRYIGPDYKNAITFPKCGPCDPRTWDNKRTQQMLEQFPHISRYFKAQG